MQPSVAAEAAPADNPRTRPRPAPPSDPRFQLRPGQRTAIYANGSFRDTELSPCLRARAQQYQDEPGRSSRPEAGLWRHLRYPRQPQRPCPRVLALPSSITCPPSRAGNQPHIDRDITAIQQGPPRLLARIVQRGVIDRVAARSEHHDPERIRVLRQLGLVGYRNSKVGKGDQYRPAFHSVQ